MACYSYNNGGFTRIDWPDGGNYFGQTKLLIGLFRVIEDELLIVLAREAKRKASRGNSR